MIVFIALITGSVCIYLEPRFADNLSIRRDFHFRGIHDWVNGETDDLDLEPVSVFYRIDGISMKRRELSNCCPMHQAFGHLAVIGLRPLLRAKLLPYQFASIPGKGQIALKRQVERWLRRKSLGIQHAVKLDVQGTYK